MAAKPQDTKPTTFTTVKDIVKAVKEGKISEDEADGLIASLTKPAPKTRARTVKLNQGGGLYVTDPCMAAYSEKKGKKYQAGLNLQPIEAVRALFANDELLAEIKRFLAQD